MASGSRTNVSAVSALLALNIFMSINQTNIASLNLPISIAFHQTLFGLGVLSSGFFVAYGLFELPGGVLAFRIGAKKLLVVGGLLTSAAVIVSAASPSFDILIFLRFFAGMGMGFSFPPILVLVIRNMRAGSTGIGTALVTISFCIAGGVGVFGWAVMDLLLGWRLSVVVGGVLCLSSTITAIWVLPVDSGSSGSMPTMSNLRRVVLNRQILILCLSFVGAGSATALVGNFMVFYLEQHFGLGGESAGLIGGLTYVLPLLSSPFFGRLYDKGYSEKRILLSGLALLAAGMGITALNSVNAAILSVLVVGLGSGIFFTVGFSVVRDRSPEREAESFAIGFVDSFSFAGFFLAPLYFSVLVLDYGYPLAWFAGSIIAIVLATPLVFLRREDVNGPEIATNPSERPAGVEPSPVGSSF